MISSEAPVVFAKACEMFVLELTLRSWIHSEENKRRTLQRNDIAAAITKTDIFDFLVDIVPRDDGKEEVGIPRAGGGGVSGAEGYPNPGLYYPMAQQTQEAAAAQAHAQAMIPRGSALQLDPSQMGMSSNTAMYVPTQQQGQGAYQGQGLM